jgi:hypothetical protein
MFNSGPFMGQRWLMQRATGWTTGRGTDASPPRLRRIGVSSVQPGQSAGMPQGAGAAMLNCAVRRTCMVDPK